MLCHTSPLLAAIRRLSLAVCQPSARTRLFDAQIGATGCSACHPVLADGTRDDGGAVAPGNWERSGARMHRRPKSPTKNIDSFNFFLQAHQKNLPVTKPSFH
jgi:hypothetical protein